MKSKIKYAKGRFMLNHNTVKPRTLRKSKSLFNKSDVYMTDYITSRFNEPDIVFYLKS